MFTCARACVCMGVSSDTQQISRIFFAPRHKKEALASFSRPLASAPQVSLDHGGRGRDIPMRAALMLL